MPEERSEAIVLRAVDFSETSRIVTLLTPERGRMACMAAGVRRSKSTLAGLLDTFNRIEMVYYWRDSRTVQKLGEASLLDGFNGIKKNLEKSTYGAVPLELAYKVAHENEPSQELFGVLAGGLQSLAAWPGDVRTHACWQLLRTLSVSGFAPELHGESTNFSFETGITHERGDVRLTKDEVDGLRAMPTDKPEDLTITPRLFRAVVRYAEHHLETSLRSARVAQEMFA